MKRIFLAALAASAMSTMHTTAQAQIVLAKSSLSATGVQLGSPMKGDFTKFSAIINFNPAKLAEATATLDIVMNSYDLGDDLYNKEVSGKNFFDAAKFPTANFVATSIKPAGAGKFEFAGKLTMKGKTQPVTAIVAYSSKDNTQIFDGELSIKRLAFGVGEGTWGDVSLVEDPVLIKFHLVNAVNPSAGAASGKNAPAESGKKNAMKSGAMQNIAVKSKLDKK